MRNQSKRDAIGGWSLREVALRIRGSVLELPFDISRIDCDREPLIAPGTEDNFISGADKIGGWRARTLLPSYFPSFQFEGINVSAPLAAKIRRDEHQIPMDERISMKAKGAAIGCHIVRPNLFARGLVQSDEFTAAGADEKKVATDRGLRKHSTPGFDLP